MLENQHKCWVDVLKESTDEGPALRYNGDKDNGEKRDYRMLVLNSLYDVARAEEKARLGERGTSERAATTHFN